MRNFGQRSNASALCFKHWGKHSFSAFNTIGREVKIGVLALSYFACIGEARLEAQNVDSSINNHEDLEEVVVSADRSAQLEGDVMRVVQVISKKDIQQAAAESVQDLLELSLNLDLRQRGQHGVQGDLSVRGGSFDQVMILLNGINISDPQTGHLSLDLPVDLDAIERIEILSGPGAVVWGPNAFSGAVNIITAEEATQMVKVRIAGGENSFMNHSVSGALPIGKSVQFISANYKKSDGFTDNTDFESKNIFYQSRWKLNDASINLQGGYTQKEYGATTFYHPMYPNQFEATKTLFGSLSMETEGTVKVMPAIYFRRHHDRFELFRDKLDAASWYSAHNYHLTDVFGANIHGSYSSSIGLTSFGMDMRNETIYSNALGVLTGDTIDAPGESDGFFTRSYSRTMVSYFLRQSVTIDWFTISAGLMTNWNSVMGRDIFFSPGADISAKVTPEITLRGSVNRSLRLPSFTDLYYNDGNRMGNSTLKPEEAITYEGGVKYAKKGLKAEAGVFVRDGKNIIDWVRKDTETKYFATSWDNVNTFGIESNIELNIPRFFDITSPINKVELSYSYLESDKTETDYDSQYTLDYLKHKLTGTIYTDITEKLKLSVSASYQDRNGIYIAYEDKVELGKKEYKPHTLVDAKLSWVDSFFTFYVSTTNVLDKSYNDISNVPQPGRWVKGGVIFTIK